MHKITKGDILVRKDGTVQFLVTRAHRDGTVSVRSRFFLRDDGSIIPGYLGFGHRRVSMDAFQPVGAA